MVASKNQFLSNAKPIVVTVNDQPFHGEVKQFSTGSVGFYANGKATVQIGTSLAPLSVNVSGTPMMADVKQFSTGSAGWYLSGKCLIPLANGDMARCQVTSSLTIVGSKKNGLTANTVVKVQVGINVIVIGSKELPQDIDTPIVPVAPVAPVAPPVTPPITPAADVNHKPSHPVPGGKKSKKAKQVA